MTNNKVIKNASWIIGCRIVQAILNLIVSMLTARFLGPDNFGIINYAASLVAFAVPIMQLGLSGVLVREIVTSPEEEGKTVGTALVLSFLSSVLSVLGVTAFAFFVNAGETVTITVCFLYSLLLLFQALEMTQYWFQAKYLSKYTSLIMLAAYAITTAYKIFLLATGKSVYWFALSYAIDYSLIAIGLLVFYKKLGTQKLSFSKKRAKELLSRSKYYIISDLMVVVFAQVSKILLKLMIEDAADAAVGYYSAAINCTTVTSFVFIAIIDSMRPLILECKEKDEKAFERNQKMLYSIVIFLSLAQSLAITLLAKPLIIILYGADYLPALTSLQIVSWYSVFSYIGSVRNIWILAEGKQKYLWVINLMGAIFNIILNFTLIPTLGILGASISTLVTQFFTNIVTGFIIKPIRHNNKLIFESLDPRILINACKKIIKR